MQHAMSRNLTHVFSCNRFLFLSPFIRRHTSYSLT